MGEEGAGASVSSNPEGLRPGCSRVKSELLLLPSSPRPLPSTVSTILHISYLSVLPPHLPPPSPTPSSFSLLPCCCPLRFPAPPKIAKEIDFFPLDSPSGLDWAVTDDPASATPGGDAVDGDGAVDPGASLSEVVFRYVRRLLLLFLLP